jgi:hypothetical protein
MKQFVLLTGIISVVAGVSLQFPAVASQMMPTEQFGMLMHVFGLMAVFIGVMLFLCSRDLKRRAPLVMWEGVLRLGGFSVMAGYGVWGGGGSMMIAAGLFDLVIGLIYLTRLPAYLGRSASEILLDRTIS